VTKREYFDLLVQTSAAGKFPAGDLAGCYYRVPEGVTSCGDRCAVGVLIPDEVYCQSFEEAGPVNSLFETYSDLEQFIPEGLTTEDLRRIQVRHDRHSSRPWNHDRFVQELLALDCSREFDSVRNNP
jgi:hypothetical protein